MQQIIETVFAKMPVVFLGAALVLLFFYPIPNVNQQLASILVAGFLGYLTGRTHQNGTGASITTSPDDSGATTTTVATGAQS